MAKIILAKQLLNDSSSWASLWVKEDPEHRIRISKVDISNMLVSKNIPNIDSIIENTYIELLGDAMQRGLNIVIDDMKFDAISMSNITKYIKEFNDWVKLSPIKIEYQLEYKGSSKDSIVKNFDFDK